MPNGPKPIKKNTMKKLRLELEMSKNSTKKFIVNIFIPRANLLMPRLVNSNPTARCRKFEKAIAGIKEYYGIIP